MKTTPIFLFGIFMCSGLLAGAEEQGTQRHLGIDSPFVTGAHWSIQEGQGILQVSLPAVTDDQPLPKPPEIQIWLLQPDGSSTKPSLGGQVPVGISMMGIMTPHMMYEFPPEEASAAVAVALKVNERFFVLPLAPEEPPAEQGGAGQPAIRPEPKPEDNQNIEIFVSPLAPEKPPAEQDGAGQPAIRPEAKPEGGDKPQPEAEGRSR